MSGAAPESGKVKPSIRVLVVESVLQNSKKLSEVLARNKSFRLIPARASCSAILDATAREKPDVAVLPPFFDGDPAIGFQVARQLRELHPPTRIVMLLERSEQSSVLEAFRAGASGILSRAETLKYLPRCISCVHAGQVWANSRELKYLIDDVSASLRAGQPAQGNVSILSRREQDVVRGVVDGLSNREIALRLNLTEHTVKNYLFRVFDKLEVSSRVEVVLYAFGLSGYPLRKSVTKPRSSRKNQIAPQGTEIASGETRKELPL